MPADPSARHPYHRVTLYALRLALHGVPASDSTAAELVAIARGNRSTLARALHRLYLRCDEHPSSVTAARAAALVRAALVRASEFQTTTAGPPGAEPEASPIVNPWPSTPGVPAPCGRA